MTILENKKKATGRPRLYTSEQLSAAIDAVRSEGGVPAPDLVAKALSSLFGISSTVRGETLAREIHAFLTAETEVRQNSLIEALPSEVTARVNRAFADVQRVASLLVAEELDRLAKAQVERDLAATRERAMLVAQNNQLEEELAGERARSAEMVEALVQCEAEKAALESHIRELEMEVGKLRAAWDARSDIIAKLELVFANQLEALPEASQSPA